MSRQENAPLATMETTACRICANAVENTPYRVREMLHGTREAFDYFECRACGCLQIAEIPKDLGRHYPKTYFSFRDHSCLARNPVRRRIDPERVKRRFGGKSLVGALADSVSRPLDYVDWVRRAGLELDARILDVGCGHGKSLICMALGGFSRCEGLDPFIDETISYPLGVTIHKIDLEAFARRGERRFDLVMFHHAFEHLTDPRSALHASAGLLTPRGRIMIVIPVAGSFAWEHYRENWCNLDAPRHLHLLTDRSMDILAKDAGLVIESATSAGALSQFVGSERYLRDIPANDRVGNARLFGRSRLAAWRRATQALNRQGRGDQTVFYLRAAPRGG